MFQTASHDARMAYLRKEESVPEEYYVLFLDAKPIFHHQTTSTREVCVFVVSS